MLSLLSFLYVLLVLPFIVAFILGFMTYGLNKTVKPSKAESETSSPKISSELRNQLKKEGYIDSNGKLKREDLVKALNTSAEAPPVAS